MTVYQGPFGGRPRIVGPFDPMFRVEQKGEVGPVAAGPMGGPGPEMTGPEGFFHDGDQRTVSVPRRILATLGRGLGGAQNALGTLGAGPYAPNLSPAGLKGTGSQFLFNLGAGLLAGSGGPGPRTTAGTIGRALLGAQQQTQRGVQSASILDLQRLEEDRRAQAAAAALGLSRRREERAERAEERAERAEERQEASASRFFTPESWEEYKRTGDSTVLRSRGPKADSERRQLTDRFIRERLEALGRPPTADEMYQILAEVAQFDPLALMMRQMTGQPASPSLPEAAPNPTPELPASDAESALDRVWKGLFE